MRPRSFSTANKFDKYVSDAAVKELMAVPAHSSYVDQGERLRGVDDRGEAVVETLLVGKISSPSGIMLHDTNICQNKKPNGTTGGDCSDTVIVTTYINISLRTGEHNQIMGIQCQYITVSGGTPDVLKILKHGPGTF